MARGMTSRLSSMSPGASVVSFMSWELVKIGVSVAMLMLAPRIVQPLSWPALLVALVLCIKVYWLALLLARRGEERRRDSRTWQPKVKRSTAGEYIVHHLTHLQNGKPKGLVDFSVRQLRLDRAVRR